MEDFELENDINLMRNYEFYTFAKEMHKKYASKVREEGRSLKPWEDYELGFLVKRLYEEETELDDAILEHNNDTTEETKEKLKQECLDVANFCMFIFLSLSTEVGEP